MERVRKGESKKCCNKKGGRMNEVIWRRGRKTKQRMGEWVKKDKKDRGRTGDRGRGRTEESERRGEGRMGSRREGRKRKGRGEEGGRMSLLSASWVGPPPAHCNPAQRGNPHVNTLTHPLTHPLTPPLVCHRQHVINTWLTASAFLVSRFIYACGLLRFVSSDGQICAIKGGGGGLAFCYVTLDTFHNVQRCNQG
jgi:hypothetical protein